MKIEIPKEIEKKLKETEKIMGIDKKEVVMRALILYLDLVNKEKELLKEIEAWQNLGLELWRKNE